MTENFLFLAKDLGFECVGSNAGNADELASLIIQGCYIWCVEI